MGRRVTGLGFCGIAAFLFAARYITAAIYGSNSSTLSAPLFGHLLSYTGNSLLVLSIISLIAGIVYLFLAETRRKQE